MPSWTIIKKRLFKKPKKKIRLKNSSYLVHKELARSILTERLEYFNQFYNFTYNRVAIRDQKRCWGSCSSKGNLNFSYKLIFLPDCLRDYIVVHELAHLKVLNHSADFWTVVALVVPDFAERAQTLRQIEKTVGTSLKSLAQVKAGHVCNICTRELELPKEVDQTPNIS